MSGRYVTEAWYVAAWSDELEERPLARVILEQPVVLFRRADRTPVALEDRCIHRRLPLSLGRVRGDRIECAYHGLQFDTSGQCVHVPGQRAIPPGAWVRSYPVVERHRCIWVWTGDAGLADPNEIRDFHWLIEPGWGLTKLHARVRCHYQLIIDNLLDLSHLAYVHASTVGSPALADSAKVTTDRLSDGVRVSRWTLDVPPAPTYRQFGKYGGNIDRWQISEFRAPGTFVIDNGSATAGTGAPIGQAGEQRWGFIVCHGITPENERKTNYFWALAHPFGVDGPEEEAEFHRQSRQVIGEDIAVFEAQQRMIELDPAAPTIDIGYDAGPLQARRLIGRLLAQQQHAPRRASA
jgi:phenylpropionate dioxygenase-like ring-hydroxylating dioxygenase large terminal subunit